MKLKLSKAKVKCVKWWLEFVNNKADVCPFKEKSGFRLYQSKPFERKRFAQVYCRDVCKVEFPKKVKLTPNDTARARECPCDSCAKTYVIRKARQLVKENKT